MCRVQLHALTVSELLCLYKTKVYGLCLPCALIPSDYEVNAHYKKGLANVCLRLFSIQASVIPGQTKSTVQSKPSAAKEALSHKKIEEMLAVRPEKCCWALV